MATILPLTGITVLDFTQIMAGPYCTLLLGDMGADVIKIEKPNGGDDSRHLGQYFIGEDSAAFLMINRNKRSIVIDLKKPLGKNIIIDMISTATVNVENFRPGVMKKLGLDYTDLKKLNPRLIYCSISGFGRTGPYSNRGGFDLIAQGMSGIMSVTGIDDSIPIKVGVPITDLNAGMYAAYGILSAYISLLTTGKGQLVDTSLLEAGLAHTFWESGEFFATGRSPKPVGSAHRLSSPYQAFKTKDGFINIGAANQKTWEKLCLALDIKNLNHDNRFNIGPKRLANRGILINILEGILIKQDSSYWLIHFEKYGVPCGPIYTMEEVYNDPHIISRNMLHEIDHPTIGKLKNIGIPVKLSDTPATIRRPPPSLGQHTTEILNSIGYPKEQIKNLRQSKVIF